MFFIYRPYKYISNKYLRDINNYIIYDIINHYIAPKQNDINKYYLRLRYNSFI